MTSAGRTWNTTPLDYLARREKPHVGERLFSQYVTVRDGTRIAVDVHLPGLEPGDDSFPVVMILTPYYRRFALREGHRPDIDAAPTVAVYRDAFVPHGYALVVVDVRGSGASFGARDGLRSPAERLDHHDVADWISKQTWCDGNIGATGISYPGAASDFLASTNHPAVKAVAPLFAVWDTWSNQLYPGGVLLTCVAQRYGEVADALDLDKRDKIPPYVYFNDPDLVGPAPVDEDPGGKLLVQALTEHHGNFEMQDFVQQLRFRDSALSEDPDYTSAVISPYHYATREADDGTAYLSLSGWMDGGYTVGAIERFKWLRNPATRLVLGPWDHGARAHVSPWRPDDAPVQQTVVMAIVLRFFDQHLRDQDTGLPAEAPVHYYRMGAEDWRAAPDWPPVHAPLTLYPAEGAALAEAAPTGPGQDDYQGSFACRTGTKTRWDRLYLGTVERYYEDWDGRDVGMLNYTGAPLAETTEVTGQGVVTLRFACSEKDCTFFVYLSDVTPEGRSVYVTEGVFRALHRAPGVLPENIPETGPAHSFTQADARHLVPGQPDTVSFTLLPTSYVFRAGHRIRVSLALADYDHFSRIPAGRPPKLTLYREPGRETKIMLPVIPGT